MSMFHRVKTLKSYLQGDTGTVVKNVVATFGIKGLALCISLFTMPAYIRYFSDQKILGVWLTVLATLTWILSFDLGIGNGLRNKLTVALAKKDEKAARQYISSAYGMIGALVLIVIGVGMMVIPFINWNGVFNISTDLLPASVLEKTMSIAFVGIMLQFLLRLISSVIYALQKAALNNLMALVTSVLLLTFALLAPSGTPTENILMFSMAWAMCANMPLLCATIVLFCGPLKKMRPNLRCITSDCARSVVSLGGIFFLCQILYMVIANTNEFFITQYVGSEYVVEYQIYYKLFSLASMLLTIALSPMWSAISKAIAEEKFDWLKSLYKTMKRVVWVGIVGEFAIILVLQWLVNVWLGENTITVNYLYAISFATFGSAMLYQSVLSTFVCGMGKMRLQAVCYGVGVVVKFLIIYFGTMMVPSWNIVVISNIVILLPYCIAQQLQLDGYFKHVSTNG